MSDVRIKVRSHPICVRNRVFPQKGSQNITALINVFGKFTVKDQTRDSERRYLISGLLTDCPYRFMRCQNQNSVQFNLGHEKGSSFEKDNKALVLFNCFQCTVSRFFNVQCQDEKNVFYTIFNFYYTVRYIVQSRITFLKLFYFKLKN